MRKEHIRNLNSINQLVTIPSLVSLSCCIHGYVYRAAIMYNEKAWTLF